MNSRGMRLVFCGLATLGAAGCARPSAEVRPAAATYDELPHYAQLERSAAIRVGIDGQGRPFVPAVATYKDELSPEELKVVGDGSDPVLKQMLATYRKKPGPEQGVSEELGGPLVTRFGRGGVAAGLHGMTRGAMLDERGVAGVDIDFDRGLLRPAGQTGMRSRAGLAPPEWIDVGFDSPRRGATRRPYVD